MARGPRIDFPGAWHHVMNRGARRAPLFEDEANADQFLRVVGETALRFEIEVHAWAVMPNHYHLLLRSVRGNLSRAMRHLGATFTQHLNQLHGWDGPVFRGRFRSQVIDSEDYLLTVVAYIHLNPVRARLIRRVDQRAWTSHRAYLGLDLPPEWMNRETLLHLAGGRAAFADFIHAVRQGSIPWPERFDAESGWLSSADRPHPWTLHTATIRDRKVAEDWPTVDETMARITALTGVNRAELRRAGRGRGANAARRFAAWALSRATPLTQLEIGRELEMSAVHVASTIRRVEKSPHPSLRAWIEQWLAAAPS